MENGKTIKQIADELGVSKQAISYRLKQLEKENSRQKNHQTLVVKKNGVLVVSLAGEMQIKSAFLHNDHQTSNVNQPPNNHQNNMELLSVLKSTIDVLQKQLAVKDNQIEQLIAINKAQAQSINADRHGELAEKIIKNKKLMLNSNDNCTTQISSEKKQSIFSRLFRKETEKN